MSKDNMLRNITGDIANGNGVTMTIDAAVASRYMKVKIVMHTNVPDDDSIMPS